MTWCDIGTGLALLLLPGALSPAPAAEPPPTAAYQRLPLREIQPQGWILAQMANDLDRGVAGHFQKFRPAYTSATWVKKDGSAGAAELTGNWLDGYLRMAHYTGNADALRKARGYIDDILGAQEPGGYVGNMPADQRYKRLNRDLFNEARTGVALLAHYELTGDRRALDAVTATARLIMAHYTPANRPYAFMPGDEGYAAPGVGDADDLVDEEKPDGKKRKPVINGHVLMYVDVCEWLHRITRDRAYIDYAAFLYNDYSSSKDVLPDDLKTATLLDPAAPFTGHAAHVAEQLRVPLFLAYAGGGGPHPRAARAAFDKLQRYLVPAGALAGDEGVHDLPPLPGQGYEYCATTELADSLASALEKTGDMALADRTEWLVFNAGQGARTPDGTMIAYVSATTLTRALEKMNLGPPHNSGGRWQYSPAHQVGGSCCTANAVKLMPHYVSHMWMKTADGTGLAALLLGPSRVTTEIQGTPVTIEESTEYPFSDILTFRITTPRPVRFPLHIRIPSWAGPVTIASSGGEISSPPGLRVIDKEWRNGDAVTLVFENPVMTRKCANGETIVHRGPLLYALPVPADKKILKKSRGGVKEFHEWELRPADSRSLAPLFLDPSLPGAGFRVRENPRYNRSMPWAEPELLLVGELHTGKDGSGPRQPATLRPMGSTLLRRAAFPTVER